MSHSKADFVLRDGPDVFSPKDLVCQWCLSLLPVLTRSQVELGRSGVAVANQNGSLALVPYSKYSFEEKMCVLPSVTSMIK